MAERRIASATRSNESNMKILRFIDVLKHG
jgi:hypothetical protein